jgi:sterol desaturase/sphingolipid hydroxylase (fatty acid hydroxylase superfamily)
MPIIQTIVIYSPPAVIAAATIEAVVLSLICRHSYDWWAYFASLTDIMTRECLINVYLSFGLALPLIGLAWTHRLTTVPLDTGAAIAVLFLGEEFCYYWFHRCSHRLRWLWSSHAVHHSPNQLNLSAAYRIGWTARLTGSNLFYVPLIWVGFPPRAVFTTLSLNLLYQFLLHATWIPKLGPLEWVLNTPSHHRVHHATNSQYLDKNYGGVLIVFDRLFGTFAAEREDEPCRYGLVEPLHSYNPVRIAFHEWLALGRDLWSAHSWREWVRAVAGPPQAPLAAPAGAAIMLAAE